MTMTLEKLRDDVVRILEATTASDGECVDVATRFNAAIRERDALRSALSELRELARDYERDRDKAEAELAALKARIEVAPRMIVALLPYTIELRADHSSEDAARVSMLDGKRVRLLVDDA